MLTVLSIYLSKRKWKSLSCAPVVLSYVCHPMDYIVHEIIQARILEWVAFPFSRGSSQTRDQTQISCIAGRFFTSWATREFQEYSSGLPALLQGIFLTQESNWGLLHCRWILYQPSYQEWPSIYLSIDQLIYLSNLSINWSIYLIYLSNLSIYLSNLSIDQLIISPPHCWT